MVEVEEEEEEALRKSAMRYCTALSKVWRKVEEEAAVSAPLALLLEEEEEAVGLWPVLLLLVLEEG
jgi:hypothetical protein